MISGINGIVFFTASIRLLYLQPPPDMRSEFSVRFKQCQERLTW